MSGLSPSVLVHKVVDFIDDVEGIGSSSIDVTAKQRVDGGVIWVIERVG